MPKVGQPQSHHNLCQKFADCLSERACIFHSGTVSVTSICTTEVHGIREVFHMDKDSGAGITGLHGLHLMVMMGLVKLPSLKDYWKRNEMFHYSPIASRISRDCFHDLHRYLHFVDDATLSPPGSPGYKKLGKTGPILDTLCQSFESNYSSGSMSVWTRP